MSAPFGKEGDSLKALYYLRRSFEINPLDPQTVYGLAFAYMELGDIEQAQKHFQKVLAMEDIEDLRGLARNGLQEIAIQGLKAKGEDGCGLLTAGCVAAVPREVLQVIHDITFEIDLQRRFGLDINYPKSNHALRPSPWIFQDVPCPTCPGCTGKLHHPRHGVFGRRATYGVRILENQKGL